MNNEQMMAAKNAMVDWLSHPHELGKAPTKIEYTGSFDLYDMHYYMFKYKKGLLGKWLLGVCGGYVEDELDHCGHVFSNMSEYNENSAVDDAKQMVEMIRSYWMEQARLAEERKENAGTFAGFVLLSDVSWDKQQLIHDLKTEWNIEIIDEDENEEALVVSIDDMTIALSLMPAPVPNGEAEQNAANNYLWKDAVEVTKAHQAHIMAAVIGNAPLIERGKLFVKLLAACCKQPNACGVYTSGTVFEPRFYMEFANMMKEDLLPIYNWIWFGLYQSEKGVNCYTYGMRTFGKDEMEVLDADANPSDVQEFLSSLVSYVLEYDVTLNDGETIGFTEDDKHSITRSEGVSLPEITLKIGY